MSARCDPPTHSDLFFHRVGLPLDFRADKVPFKYQSLITNTYYQLNPLRHVLSSQVCQSLYQIVLVCQLLARYSCMFLRTSHLELQTTTAGLLFEMRPITALP